MSYVSETTEEKLTTVSMQWGVRIPMRDGLQLNGTLYLPKSHQSPSPVVVSATPYVSDTYHPQAVYFASKGMPFLNVDVRGRGNSDGVFRPCIQEAKDGYDLVEWIAAQPYCNGKVGLWGGSYSGYTQWATAKELPPHLATIVPTAPLYMGGDFPMRNNILFPYLVQWLTLTDGYALQARIFSDNAFWSSLYREWHESGRPFRDVDALFGNPSPIFQEWLKHPEPDAYWDQQNPTPEQCAQLNIPVLSITGAYDDDQPGALEHYRQHLRYGPAGTRERHYLVIGPWNHGGTGMPSATFGGLKVGLASVIDIQKLHLDWYSWTMQSGPKPEFLKRQIAYYVMGAECWRYADTLEEITERHQPYFLSSPGSANDVFHAGSLEDVPGSGQPDIYRYDPRDTSGIEVEVEARADCMSLVDQSLTLALCGKQLVYHSAPFEQDTEVSGFFKLSAWIAIDCPDTDFFVSVHEIGLDGGSVRLCTDGLRARYREGLRTPRLIDTTEPLRYDFERFTFISRRIKAGHRLRLVIAPMGRMIEATFAQKNYNSGGVVAEESAEGAKAVTVRLFHDAAHPSALYIPIGKSE